MADSHIIPPHEHCWHSHPSQVIRPGVNVHGPYCTTHPDVKKPHEHVVIAHNRKCCQCPAVSAGYVEYVDTGEKERKKK